ncbi:facilitated trehalose transporter Tret1-2 homolog [Bombus huntii]|uniref:facilitated trehalose transporter Tret1-2 homolog n=1 Tax=Bombus huntii TaxID=85661 RepID=UPI0021A98D89|nr:facilitated trehalose transporter Tret1-2 homolog [Bombus huntii]
MVSNSQCQRCLISITATLAMVIVGSVNGWTTISLYYLITGIGGVPLTITHDESSWVVSLTVLGSMIGSLVAAQLAARSGSNICLVLCNSMFTLGWFITYDATSVPMLYLARVILGIGVGIAHTINPMYVSEVANRNLRGALGTLIAINALKGSLLTCTLGLFLTYKSLLTVLVIISFISLFSNTCFPETPYFLLAKGRKQQARKSIAYYKGIADPHRVEFELHPQCAQTRHELLQQSTSDLHSESRSNLPSQSTCEAHLDPIREVDIEATSDLHLPSSSDSHAQSISSVHSTVICEVHTQPTGESRVEYSRDSPRLPPQTSRELHSQSTSDLHRPTTSQVHRPSTSEIHPEATSEIHPETTSEIHPETTSEIHPEATSEIHPETTSEIHRPSTSEILRPSTSEVHRPSTGEVHRPSTSEVHRPSTSEVHRPSTSEVHRPSTSEVHRPSTSEVHRPSTSEVHRPSTSEVHRPSTSEVHRPSTSEVHRPSTSEVHRPSTSEVHRPSTSEVHSDDSDEMLPDRTCEILSGSNEYLRKWADIDEIHVDFTKYNWSTKLRAILQRSNRKALFIMLGLTMAQHLSGNYITTQYLKVLLSKTAIALNPYKTTLAIHIISILSGGFTIATVEYLGRRTLLIMSTLGTCCPLIILANYLLLVEHKFDVSISSIPISNLVTQQIMFQIGLGTLPNVLRCELFPAELRGFVGAIIVIFDGIIGFTVSKLYQVITNNIGSYANYMIFGASCCLAFMMVIIWIPETKGKTYREIEALLFGENFNSLNEEVSNDEMDTRRI